MLRILLLRIALWRTVLLLLLRWAVLLRVLLLRIGLALLGVLLLRVGWLRLLLIGRSGSLRLVGRWRRRLANDRCLGECSSSGEERGAKSELSETFHGCFLPAFQSTGFLTESCGVGWKQVRE